MSAEVDLTGKVIDGRYRVVERLGRGGMGAVFRVQHIHSHEHFALKVLHPNVTADKMMVERFVREARAAAALKSRHVVKVVDAQRDQRKRVLFRGAMPMRRSVALLVSLSIATASLSASADAYDAAMARAAAAKEKALDANDASSWEEALSRFREADAIQATKESKYEVATAAAWLKQDDLAVEAYQEALALNLGDPAKTKAETFIAERAAKVTKLTVTGPAGARVLVDGRPRGTLPRATPFVVFVGTIKVRVEGVEVREDSITTAAGTPATFDGMPAKPPPEPPAPKPVVAPQPAPVVVDSGSSTLGWSLLITGGVVAVIGLGTTVYAVSQVKKYDDRVQSFGCTKTDGTYCTELPPGTSDARHAEATEASNSFATWRGIRTAGLVTAIGGAVTAVVGGVILLGKQKEAPRASFASLPGGGFLSLSGTF